MPACFFTWFGFYGDLQAEKVIKKCQKCRFWSLNLNYPIWCLNIMPRHLQWPSIVKYDWNYDSACVLICLEVYGVPQLVKNMPKLWISPPGSRISNLIPQYCTRRFYYYLWSFMIDWYVTVRFELIRGLWWSSGEKIGQRYATNAYFVTPWIPNIQYDSSIVCQDILNYYLRSYSDQDWYASMCFDLFQSLWRSPGPKIC